MSQEYVSDALRPRPRGHFSWDFHRAPFPDSAWRRQTFSSDANSRSHVEDRSSFGFRLLFTNTSDDHTSGRLASLNPW